MNRTLTKLVFVLALVVLGSGVLGAAAAATNMVGSGSARAWKPAWFMIGFEVLVALAGGFGVLLARGRFGSTAFGVVCVAGTVIVASLFGYLGSGGTVWGVGLKPLLIGRAGLALGLVTMAGLIQISGKAGAAGLLVRGVVLGALAIALPMVGYAMRGTAAGWSEILVLSLLMVGFVAVVGLIAASADCLIGAFRPKEVEPQGG